MCRFVSFTLLLLVALGFAVNPTQGAAAPARSHKHAHTTNRPKAHASSAARSRSHVAARNRIKPALSPRARATARSPYRSKQVKRVLWRKRDRMLANPAPRLQLVHLAMPPPLRGSHESLVHQNVMAEADGLERIRDDEDLQDRIDHGSLVRVPLSSGLRINTDLPDNRRYCRPWTAQFLSDLSQAHSSRFGTSIEVTSAVRTVEYQRRLRLTNGNAAAADGDIASPHLTGGTIDIAKQGMSSKEIGWLRGWLIPLEQAGLIDVEEEFKQSCFHISVYRSYSERAAHGKVSPKSGTMADPTMLAVRSR
jgi:hypothetical protein